MVTIRFGRRLGHEMQERRLASIRQPSLAVMLACAGSAMLTAPAAHAADGARTLDDVVVTGQRIRTGALTDPNAAGTRLGLTALETPATVQVVTGDEIQLRGDLNIVDAVSRVAGIAALPTPGSGGYGFAARGFGSASVTILYDGVKSLINTGSLTFPYDAWNVARIEVLNGAASVMVGSGAIGAAINVVPKQPQAEREHVVQVGAGSFGSRRVALDTTGPLFGERLDDRLAYRVYASHHESEGFVDRGDSDATAVGAALAFRHSERMRTTVSGEYAERRQMFWNGLPLIGGRLDESLRRVNYGSLDARIPFRDWRMTATTHWQPAEDVEVRNDTYYIRGERLWRYPTQYVHRPATNDVLRRAFGTFTQSQNQLGTHVEVAFARPLFGLPNRFAVGFDADRLINDRYVDSYAGSDVLDLRNTRPGVFPTTIATRNHQRSYAEQFSAFAESQLKLSPALSLVTGLRADRTDVERTNLVDGTVAAKDYRPVSWRAGLVHAIAPRFTAYAQVSTAVDPVGNLCCVTASQLGFDLSDGRQVEAGLKQVAWGGRLEWSLAGYEIVKRKLLTPDPANLGLSLQVGRQSSRGLEATVAWSATPALRVELATTKLRARYDDFAENVGGVRVSRNGLRPINVPERFGSLWMTWVALPRLQFQAGVEYGGDRYANSSNTLRLPSYAVLDAGLRWQARPGLSIDLRGSNLLDRVYAFTSVADGSGGGQWILGAPRGYDLTVLARFR